MNMLIEQICLFQWDGAVGLWEYNKCDESDAEMSGGSDSDSDLSDDMKLPRRSRRLRKRSRSSRTQGRRFVLF